MNKLVCDATSSNSVFEIRDYLYKQLKPILSESRTIVVVCIGTDRSTGDSLGPLIGYKLKCLIRKKLIVYGDLENPVHAKNLQQVLNEINSLYDNAYIIAIDACLGQLQNVGKVFLEQKPLYPGLAVNKILPAIGDLSITGIVNISGNFEFMVLQNTRLYTVMTLADTISKGIYHFAIKSLGGRNTSIDHVLENISSTN